MSGKITGQRILSVADGGPKMESSFQGTGSLLGTKMKDTGTYWTVARADGTLYGEGHGVTMLGDGKIATWKGHGVGTTNKDGSASYRGTLYYQTMPAEWSTLNKIGVLFEYEIDAEGKHPLGILAMEVGGTLG